jgi:biotin carboxylase
VPKRLLLFAATTGYQIRVFADAARRMGVELTLATDRCHILDDPWGDHAIAVRFDHIAGSLEALRGRTFDGVAAVGDRPAILAAEAARVLGLPFHSPAAARACHDKYLARTLLHSAGVRVPRFHRARSASDYARFPCVLKPLGLSASQGVIRADDPAAFAAAYQRIQKMGESEIQVEDYIPGREFAVEGVVTAGRFRALAIFDKPDPLEGPYFEESIYVTPSGEPEEVRRAIIDTCASALHALGLRHGPVHAELRYNSEGAWMLEAHARPIGGLCAKALAFVGQTSRSAQAQAGRPAPLEELILRHALGEDVTSLDREPGASGVMMIAIPKAGLYQSVEGVEQASAIPGIEEVLITAAVGQRLQMLPEGSSYPGFIFARAESPAGVEAALRRAHAELRFHIAAVLETFRPSS